MSFQVIPARKTVEHRVERDGVLIGHLREAPFYPAHLTSWSVRVAGESKWSTRYAVREDALDHLLGEVTAQRAVWPVR